MLKLSLRNMGIQDLQTFLDNNSIQGSWLAADLLKIARAVHQRQRNRAVKGPQGHPKFKLVLDGECCLDRLYGGYFSGKSSLVYYMLLILE